MEAGSLKRIKGWLLVRLEPRSVVGFEARNRQEKRLCEIVQLEFHFKLRRK